MSLCSRLLSATILLGLIIGPGCRPKEEAAAP
jgi:hypothetical protein